MAKGRCKLIAHVGDTSTDVSVALAKAAADIGVDWLSSVAPPVFCTNFNRTFQHYKRVSEATDLPFMAYSIGSDLVPFAHKPHVLLYGFFGMVACLVVAPLASRLGAGQTRPAEEVSHG